MEEGGGGGGGVWGGGNGAAAGLSRLVGSGVTRGDRAVA